MPKFFIALLLVAFAPTLSLAGDKKAAKDGAAAKGVTDDDANFAYIQAKEKVLDGKYEEALPLFEKALKGDPENAYINSQLSEIYMRLSNFDKAEEAAKKAVEKEPSNIEYRTTYGGILASLKKYPEAQEQYKKIVELDPTNQRAPLLMGLLAAEEGQMEEGVKILSKAVDDNSDNFMAYFYRAKIYLEMDKVNEAKADLNKSLSLRPNFVEAGAALGLLHEKLGETDEAIKAYSRIQGDGHFKKRLAQLYLQKNEYEKALNELLEYEKLEPDDYSARVKAALIYFELKQYDKAAGKLNDILKEQPKADNDNVHFYLGAVYEEMKQPEKANAEFKKVTKESAYYREAMLHIGFILRDEEKYKEGIDFAKTAVDKNPDIAEFYDMLASFHELQKDYSKAMAVIEKALKRFPQDEKLLYFEGALFDKMGDKRKAITVMKKIIDVNGNNAHALNFLGYTYAELGENLDEAENYVNKALTLRPDDGYIIDSLGWVLFKKGNIDGAIERLEKAAKLQNEEPVIFEHLGDVYLAKKEFTKAAESYKKAVSFSTKKDKDMAKKLEVKIANLPKDKRTPSQESDSEKPN